MADAVLPLPLVRRGRGRLRPSARRRRGRPAGGRLPRRPLRDRRGRGPALGRRRVDRRRRGAQPVRHHADRGQAAARPGAVADPARPRPRPRGPPAGPVVVEALVDRRGPGDGPLRRRRPDLRRLADGRATRSTRPPTCTRPAPPTSRRRATAIDPEDQIAMTVLVSDYQQGGLDGAALPLLERMASRPPRTPNQARAVARTREEVERLRDRLGPVPGRRRDQRQPDPPLSATPCSPPAGPPRPPTSWNSSTRPASATGRRPT